MPESGLTPVAFFGHGSPTTILDDPATMSAWSTLAGIIAGRRPSYVFLLIGALRSKSHRNGSSEDDT